MASRECVVPSRDRHSGLAVAVTAALSFALISPAGSSAQQLRSLDSRYVITSWTEQDGLASNQVEALAQTPDGYLWIGTQGGLMRFDGVRFVRPDAADGRTLPAEGVSVLHVSRDGSLWVGFAGAGGISRIDGDRVVNYASAHGLTRGRVLAIEDAADGAVWAGGVDGLFRLRGDRWERVGMNDGFSGRTVVSLYEDRDRHLWVGADTGTFIRRAGAERFQLLTAKLTRASGFSEAPDGSLLISMPAGVFRTLGVSDDFHPIWPEGTDNYFRLRHDRDGNLWVATLGGGLLHVPARNAGNRVEATRFTAQSGLIGDLVWAVLDDREGNIWVGTQNGLTRLTPSRVVSMIIPGPTRVARAVEATPDGTIWAATPAGLIRFIKRKGEWRASGATLGSGLDVTALHTDCHGTLWVATLSGLYRYQRERFEPLSMPGATPPHWIVAMTTDHRGGLWMRARNGRLLVWRSGELSAVDTKGIGGRSALAIYTDANGDVWTGFADGGIIVFRDGQIAQSLEMAPPNGDAINTFFEDQTGVMWVGSATSLSRFDDGRQTTLLLERAGLTGGNLTSILEGDGSLWLGVRAGIVRLDFDEVNRVTADAPASMRYQLLDTSDGLNGSPGSIGRPSAIRAPDGTLAFITGHGVSMVSPERFKGMQPPPAAKIERVVADERSLSPAGDVHFPPRTNRIQIDYTAMTLAASERVRFRYRLEGFDEDWVDAGHSRQAVYTNLPPGRYRFHVGTRSKEGVWSESNESWAFVVQPSFYQTTWFTGGWMIAAGAVLCGAWLLRVRHLRQGFALVLAERARVAREIHDTLLQTLVGLTLKVDAIEERIDCEADASVMKQQLASVRRQLQRSIRETRESIRALRCPALERRPLVVALREAATVSCGGRLSFELEVEGQPVAYPKAVEEQLLRIAQEALSNVVRHADARQVRVTLCYATSGIRLRVTDDGAGFDPEKAADAPDHWGIMTMRERAAQIGGRIEFRSRPGEGAVVEVSVPASLARPARGDEGSGDV